MLLHLVRHQAWLPSGLQNSRNETGVREVLVLVTGAVYQQILLCSSLPHCAVQRSDRQPTMGALSAEIASCFCFTRPIARSFLSVASGF
nr:hypothetical protein CFP56_30121 [Quercus suber]